MYKNLFKPIKINQLMLSNRIIGAPISTVDTYEFASSGTALNIIGCVFVDHPSARCKLPSIKGDYHFAKDEKFATRKRMDFFRSGGAYLSAEVWHPGMWSRADGAYSASDGVNPEGFRYRALSVEQIHEISDAFARTALDCKNFGYNMVMLHFAHGWLIPQFLSSRLNHRTDEYGGTFENRERFALEVLRKVREAVGPDFPVDMRVSCKEWIEGGIEFEETLRFIKDAKEYIDMVNLSAGLDLNKKYNIHMAASQYHDHCLNAKYARIVKEETDIPVAVVGSIMTPEEADRLIEEGYCDMVTIGRALIADPLWVKKAKKGLSGEIVPCIRCGNCSKWSNTHDNTNCSVNVRAYKDTYTARHSSISHAFLPFEVEKTEDRKHVMIIGGGPAGMRAALVAAQRGHDVDLYEAEDRLGGLMRCSDYDPLKQDLKRYKDYLINQVNKQEHIRVHLNVRADKKTVEQLHPDEILVAIGSMEKKLQIPGAERSLSLLEAYPRMEELPHSIAIVGGGVSACEFAIELANRGHHVELFEMDSVKHRLANVYTGFALDFFMEQHGDEILYHTSVKVSELSKEGLVYEDENGKKKVHSCDQVVISIGLFPKTKVAHSFYDIDDIPCHMIGDCVRIGQIVDANDSAYYAASNL